MAKKKKSKKKKSGLAGYQRFINSKPGVKAAKRQIARAEALLKKAKRKKEVATNKAKKAYAKKKK